jgi:hypothetical protein
MTYFYYNFLVQGMDEVHEGNYTKNRIFVNQMRFEVLTDIPINIAIF